MLGVVLGLLEETERAFWKRQKDEGTSYCYQEAHRLIELTVILMTSSICCGGPYTTY